MNKSKTNIAKILFVIGIVDIISLAVINIKKSNAKDAKLVDKYEKIQIALVILLVVLGVSFLMMGADLSGAIPPF